MSKSGGAVPPPPFSTPLFPANNLKGEVLLIIRSVDNS